LGGWLGQIKLGYRLAINALLARQTDIWGNGSRETEVVYETTLSEPSLAKCTLYKRSLGELTCYHLGHIHNIIFRYMVIFFKCSSSRCCCCGCSNRPSKSKSDKKCTAAKVKSCLKLFFAQVFSHVGLCALVVGYSIMGAFIFGYLEKDNEQQIRDKVRDVRRQTLDQLYDITGNERLAFFYCVTKVQINDALFSSFKARYFFTEIS